MSTMETAKEFSALVTAGKLQEAMERFYSPEIVSIESSGDDKARAVGLEAVQAKGEWWAANFETHGITTKGPWVNGDQFILEMAFDVTQKASGRRMVMEEAGLYTVGDGKIVQESFFDDGTMGGGL